MTKNEYFIYAIKNKLHHKKVWMFTLFTKRDKNYMDNDYLKISNGYVEVNVDGEFVKLDGVGTTDAVFGPGNWVTIPPGVSSLIKETKKTTIGRMIWNTLIIERNFGDLIPYMESKGGMGKVEEYASRLALEKKITAEQLFNYCNAATYLNGLSRLFVISATPKFLLKPPNIDKIKEDTIKKYDLEYGKDWKKNRSRVIQWEEELVGYDKEWLKGDPAEKMLLSAKKVSRSRIKQYITFGAERAFDSKDINVQLITNSLSQNYPKDPEALTVAFNTSRAGSYLRGADTQKGGTVAKNILKAVQGVTVINKDCGSTTFIKLDVTNKNHSFLLDRYYKVNGKLSLISNTESLIGKTIEIRSPMTCRCENGYLCTTCLGKGMEKYPSGITLMAIEISSAILAASMAAMHNTKIVTTDFVLTDVMY